MSLKHAFMTSSCPSYSLAQVIAAAEQYEYDGVEARIEWDHQHGIEPTASGDERIAIRRAFEKSDIALCCISTGCRYAKLETLDEQVAHTHVCIDLAGDVGCGLIRVFGGHLGDMERQPAAARIINALMAVADHAAERHVTVVIETHDSWTDPADLVPIVAAVNHPNVAVLWDITHPEAKSGKSITTAHDELTGWIKHVHIHDGIVTDGKYEWKPIGEGQFDLRSAISLLLREGYDGYISQEWIRWEAPEVHLPRELATLKRYEQELLA